jgi:hypothetical protein
MVIKLRKTSLHLPETWEEIPRKHISKIFGILAQVLSQSLDPVEARLQMLFILTGYRPSLTITNREAINDNLFRISEKLTFAFTIANNQITPNLTFKRNPVPELRYGKKMCKGRDFIRDFTVKTDFTAREFCDCFDFYCEYHRNPANAKLCIDNICQTVFHAGEKCSDPAAEALKFGIFIWFSSIVNFFYTHPVYGILFAQAAAGDDSDKINLGMSETLISLLHEGFNPDINLIDFFNAQIKLLKDNIRNAIASGAKIPDIANKTKLSPSTINKLL